MDPKEQLFLNFNFVKGAQKFLKEAGLLKYAAEEEEVSDANILANAMMGEGMEAPVEGELDENKILEVANTLIELAQGAEEPVKEKLEDAAEAVVESVSEEPAAAPVEEASEAPVLEEEKKEASKIAKKIKKANEAGTVTDPKPEQVLDISKTDYNKGLGNTTLDTSKGEIGAQENVEAQNVQPKKEEANLPQAEEGDIHKTDYNKGLGNTSLNTEKGEIGSQENVEAKVTGETEVKTAQLKEMARKAMEANLAKLLKK